MNVTSTNTIANQLSPAEKKEIQEIAEYWEQSFPQLKTLDMEVVCTAQIENGVDVNNRLVYQGRIVYEANKYYYEIRMADKKGALGDPVKKAFDGHYYWEQTINEGQKTIVRSLSDSFVPLGMGPLLGQFNFVFDIDSKQTFTSFYAPETWGFFKNHVVKVEKPMSDSKDRLIFQTRNEKTLGTSHEAITESYTVHIASGDTPYPSFWEKLSTKFPVTKFGFVVSESREYSQGALHFSFPVRYSSFAYVHNVLKRKRETEIPINSLKINRPVNPDVFVIKEDQDTIVLDNEETN